MAAVPRPGTRRNRVRNALVVSEVALALVLLVGASLLLKSFVRLQNVDPGFDPRNVLTMEISLPLAKYPRGKPVADFYAEMIRRVQALPGVEAAALTSILPLSGNNSDSSFAIEGRDPTQEKVYPGRRDSQCDRELFQGLEESRCSRGVSLMNGTRRMRRKSSSSIRPLPGNGFRIRTRSARKSPSAIRENRIRSG